jgi:hypothetical protein
MGVLTLVAEPGLAGQELAMLAKSTLDEHWAVSAGPADRR